MYPFKNRSLRVDILTIFLVLISISSIVIISFSYVRTSESILKISKKTIHQASLLISERIECFLNNLERTPKMTTGIFSRYPDISSDNALLNAYFLDTVKFHPHLYSFYIGMPNGNFMEAWNVALSGRANYLKDAPVGTAYALLIINRSANKEEMRYYDADLQLLLTERFSWRGFDPRTRPWYAIPEGTKGIYWSDIFDLALTEKTGISASKRIYGADNELLGTVGANLYLDAFSEYLTEQKISDHGHAFIIDKEGKIIVPSDTPDSISTRIIPLALKQNAQDMTIEMDGETYLVSLQKLPVAERENWQIIVIAPLLDFFAGVVKTQHQTVLISLIILALAGALVIYFAGRISKPIVILAHEVDKITQLDLTSKVQVKSDIREINLLNSAVESMRNAIGSFSRYVPKEIVKTLLEKRHVITLGGEKREVTLFFSDVTDLTPIAESLPLEQLNTLLAEYFDGMSKIILKDQGTIDKYIGDSIMAFWNAPSDLEDHANKACIAALECQQFVEEFNRNQIEKGMPELKTRIGINTGVIIAGNIGTKERMNYTIIGDAVNTAERLETINKIYHTQIIIGEETAQRIGNQFLIRPLDYTEVKGRKEKVRIYELVALMGQASEEQKQLCAEFSVAYEVYHRGELEEAKKLFSAILKRFPDDYPSRLYLDRTV